MGLAELETTMRQGYLIKHGQALTGLCAKQARRLTSSQGCVVEILDLEEIWPVHADDHLREAGFHAEERRYS